MNSTTECIGERDIDNLNSLPGASQTEVHKFGTLARLS